MASLLTVRGDRFELGPGRSYVLGRDRDCDIVVDDAASSRRHAQITAGTVSHALSVEDLGSCNGTYVNEERVTRRTPLWESSRLRIGATLYLVGHDESSVQSEVQIDTRTTVSLERLALGKKVDASILRAAQSGRHLGTEFAGQLHSLGLLELLHLLIQTRRSGTLYLALESGDAEVKIRKGEVRAASHLELKGFEALLALVPQETGFFWFVEKLTRCRKALEVPTERLLVELCRAVDERGSASRRLYARRPPE